MKGDRRKGRPRRKSEDEEKHVVLRSDSNVAPGPKPSTPAYPTWCTQAPPHSAIFIPEPGDVLVQFRTELYYGHSSRGPWAPNVSRESWGSRDGPNFL